MSTERCPTAADRFLKAKRGLFDRLYGTMNEKQREAVFKIDGPLLILAGAGTGKTTVLVNRIAFIVKFGNAYADESIPAELSERDIKALERRWTWSQSRWSRRFYRMPAVPVRRGPCCPLPSPTRLRRK